MPSKKPKTMHPRDFEVNRTWLAFRANLLPIKAEGKLFDIFVLQDAGSMLLFGNAFAPHGADSPTVTDAEALLQQAFARGQAWPRELLVPGKPSPHNSFAQVAQRHGIAVRAVPEPQMSLYIKDVQTSLEEFFSRTADDA